MDSDKNITAQFDKISAAVNQSTDKLSVYPTHFKNDLTISKLDWMNEELDIELYSISGMRVFCDKLVPGQSIVSLDLSELNPGTYILSLKYGSTFYSKTLVKSSE
jgi:hypothetical protein